MKIKRVILFVFTSFALSACNNDTSPSFSNSDDNALRLLINGKGLSGDVMEGRNIPSINSPKAQLGMRLFFSKALGGDRDSACVACHHPNLGGGDNLSLSIGVGAEDPNLIGLGRKHAAKSAHFDGAPPVPRNAPTTFNIAGWDETIFHDGRVESFGKTPKVFGNDGLGIRTPDVGFDEKDTLAGRDLVIAQARFPVTSKEEMKGFSHDDKNNQQIRGYIASRLGNYGEGAGELSNPDYWLTQFRTAYNRPDSSPEGLIVEKNIAELLATYESSQAFTNSPWKKYVKGDLDALSESAKQGALLFFNSKQDGGANCSSCHSGDFFSDEKFHNIAMPQIGNGKGNGSDGSKDFGRYRETKLEEDKFAFRTPTLLNVAVTGPFTHTGSYTSLESVIKHHLNPAKAIANYDFSQLQQNGISNLEKMQSNTSEALNKLEADRLAGLNRIQNINLSEIQISQLVDFMKALTDPCVTDKSCMSKWIPPKGEDPNGDQLDGVDANGDYL